METNNVPTLKRNDSFLLSTTPSFSGLFIYDGVEGSWNSIEGKVDGFDSPQLDSMLASQISECIGSCCFNAKVLAACQTTEYAKTYEKGCLHKVLNKDTLSEIHTSVPLEAKFCFSEKSSETVDSNPERHLGENFIEVIEGFQDDFLEDVECSDVMTEEIYQYWQAKLKFLLESDDEGGELIPSSDCGGCAYFLSERTRPPFQVSDNTMPMDTTIGFSKHQSKSKEVAVRSDLTAYRPSTLQTGMTLTVGQQQSQILGMKNKEKHKQLVAPAAIKNNYSTIEEENLNNNYSRGDVSAFRSQRIDNGTSAMKSSSNNLDVSSPTTDKRDVADRTFSEETHKPQQTEQQGIDPETSASISNDKTHFIRDPALDERLVFTPSRVKNVSGPVENSTLQKVNRKTGSPIGKASLENMVAVSGNDGTQGVDKQCPGWDQALHVTTVHNRANCDYPNALCNIPVSIHDRQMEKACVGKPHEVNTIKILHDIPRAQHPSKDNFNSVLESCEHKDRDADLSSMCEQSQKLLYEKENWGDDFSCTSKEVKSLAAGTASAKKVRGLKITVDVSGRQLVPGNLTEDNQHVSELATGMKVHTDSNNLLKTDEACSGTSRVNSTSLPEEPDSMNLHSGFQHKREKPSVHLLRGKLKKGKYPDKQSETQHGHNGSIQKPAYQEDTVMTEKAFQCCQDQEPAFRFVDAPENSLEPCQEMLLKHLPNNLGQFSPTEQKVNWKSGHIAKEANEIPLKERRGPVSQSRIKDHPLKGNSSRNLSGKIMDPLTSKKHNSVMAINRSAKEDIQGKRSKSELNAKRDRSCGIYSNSSNSKDCKAIPDAQNYTYHMQEHNSLMATEPKADWQALGKMSQDKIIERGTLRPIFTASYKVRFFTEVLLEINNFKTNAKQKCTDFAVNLEPIVLDSKHVSKLPPYNSQHSEKSSTPVKHLNESIKSLSLDLACSPFETNILAGPNTVQPSSTTSTESCDTSQNTQNGVIGNITAHGQDISKFKKALKSCNANILAISEHLGQTESIQIEMERSVDTKTGAPWQDKNHGMEENRKTQIIQSEKDCEMFVAHDLEEAEVDSYVTALIDSPQGHSWHDSHGEYQKMERQSQGKIMPHEMDTKETEESVGDNLDDVEVEPYMRALINSEPIYSWHDYPDCMPPFMDFSKEQAAVPVGRLDSERTVTTTEHNQSRTFTDGERQNSSEHGVEILESPPFPCASENSYHSGEKALPQVKTQQRTLGTDAGDICALENERTTSQEASKVSKPLSPHKSADDLMNGPEIVKKMMPKVQFKKPCLETKENVCNNTSCIKNIWRTEDDLMSKEYKREEQKMLCKKDNKAPKLLKKIQSEVFPDFSGNIKLCCQFGEIHSDSTITWTKDSKLLARVHRSARDDLPVSLAIVQAGKKDQGQYHCCLKNIYGKATSEFNLTSEVLEHLLSLQDVEGLEEIEFLQLMFREDFICDSYLSKSLHGRITTEELHFGEGVHRKAFRSKVMQGLVPPLSPGHPCVLKVHNAIVYGTKNNDELVKKNYKLALQECYVQNTAREYAKIYAAETQPLEGFGDVPEIIPIFLIHRPKNNIPYATVEEELIGEFVKYSVRDGKEINSMRRDSEAGQKCCTFQHWVYEKTSGSLLVTDMQGVGMKLTDVGIATLAKGYKGFKGNCSISFIDQFKVLHQCNKYCEMLGLKPFQSSGVKHKKPAVSRVKAQSNSSIPKKMLANAQTTKKT